MKSQDHTYSNHLIHESSPYLLQHAHNPVNWYPWGSEALDRARKEEKLIIVSIGYAACHWCHVMEHESFADEQVAQFMNDHFVAIKVDREERPDIDRIYMHAVQLISGTGGWPLNCVALPDGRPLYGGTYFPRAQWIDMLSRVVRFVRENPGKAEAQADALARGVRSGELMLGAVEEAPYTVDDLRRIVAPWKDDIDFTYGGHKRAPKFPLPAAWQFLLHYHHLTGDADALKAVTTTLDRMADGGIYDQIGGGFARYSTDMYWKVPHFEKMLYDNAQLVSLYAAAYQLTRDSRYRRVVTETMDFIQRELSSPEGGFYSSFDADSEGEEGKFYVWTRAELRRALGEEADLIGDYFSVTEEGNWENGKNILFRSVPEKEIAHRYGLTEDELARRVQEAKALLLRKRVERIQPELDDKILTAWNALMLKACAEAYRVLDVPCYRDMAVKNAAFINREMKSPDGRLSRSFKNGAASINAFLDDYAFVISAFIALYQATFDERWLRDARQLADYVLAHFYDATTGMFFYTSDIDPALIARTMELADNVIPASNSEMAKNLYLLGHYFADDGYIRTSERMLAAMGQNPFTGGAYYANWDILMAWIAGGLCEVAILGEEAETRRRELDAHYLPQVLISGGTGGGTLPLLEHKPAGGSATVYVCRDRVCRQPETTVGEALKHILRS